MKITNGFTVFTGYENVQISIANAFGKPAGAKVKLDKDTWMARLSWVNTNETELESLASIADDIYGYTKAVNAYRDVQKGIPTGFACGIDATASGLQILGSLTGCMVTGTRTNLVNDGTRHCAHSEVNAEMQSDVPHEKIKECVMQHFFCGTKTAKETFSVEELMLFNLVVKIMFPGASSALAMLSNLHNVVHGGYVMTAPDDHHCVIEHRLPLALTLPIDIKRSTEFVWNMTFQSDIKTHNERDLSIPANVTHMFDAWLVRSCSSKLAEQGIEMYHVHDCFFVKPSAVNQLRQAYRESMSQLASGNYLERVIAEIAGIDVPELVFKETELSKAILKSEYALC